MQNTWNTEPKVWERQSVDRIPVMAYINDYQEVEIDAIIVNGFLVDMDFRGYRRTDFQDLETDTREALTLYGFNIAGRDSIGLEYFNK